MIQPFIYLGLPEKAQLMARLNRQVYDIETIVDAVCETLNVTHEGISSNSRKREVVEARCIAIGLILQVNRDVKLKELGRHFNRDHSTIIYNRELYSRLYKSDKQFTAKANKVLNLV